MNRLLSAIGEDVGLGVNIDGLLLGDRASAMKAMLETLQAKLASGYLLVDGTGISKLGLVDRMQ